MSNQVKCPHCNAEVSRGFFRSHQLRPDCLAAKNTKHMERHGYVRCWTPTEEILNLNPRAFEFVRMSPTAVLDADRRTGLKKRLQSEAWIPGWLGELFSGLNCGWRSQWMEGWDGDSNLPKQGYADLIASLHDPAIRESVEGVFRMGGVPALRALVITNQLRAERLRKKAADLIEGANKLLAEAEALYPVSMERTEPANDMPHTSAAE